ncbi:hypothetical protein E8E11_008030 [Didymella keratinophila]|nr:hypothetical protein E8E11_008030 [Didymella keratinophila]
MARKSSLRGSPNATERAEPNASERGASLVPDRQAHGHDDVASIRSLRARIPTTAVVIQLKTVDAVVRLSEEAFKVPEDPAIALKLAGSSCSSSKLRPEALAAQVAFDAPPSTASTCPIILATA